jgi:uncharacterized membrane protein
MDLVILDETKGFLLFALRWIHFLAGITWIGLLYYFNFVQAPFFAETEAPVRVGAISKLVPRALWWFRWGAMFTFLSGILYLILWLMWGPFQDGNRMAQLSHAWGISIQIGALLGIIMFLNVWLVIWPAQKKVIANNDAVAAGKPADPAAAPAGAKAFVASRTNTLLSIPMLFFMGAATHLPMFAGKADGPWPYVGAVLAIIALIELNVLFGKKGQGFSKLLEKHVSVIHVGILLAAVFYLLVDMIPGQKVPGMPR